MNDRLIPCLWFDDQAEQAAAFYIDTFGSGRVLCRGRYPQSFDNPAAKPRGSVMSVEFETGGLRFTAVNGGPAFAINPSISFFAYVDRREAAQRLFETLAVDGKALMPLDDYGFGRPPSPSGAARDLFGWVADRFGVSWQVMTVADAPAGVRLVPCLMFSDANRDQAEAAIASYTSIFPDSRVERLERHTGDEAPAGTLRRGLFEIAGQPLVAMDSHIDHGFGFNEAVSLQIMCAEQREVDAYWHLLSQGGSEQMCGWLRDRFGVVWQVVPARTIEWLSSADHAARDRVVEAMMPMKKLQMDVLQRAFDGR